MRLLERLLGYVRTVRLRRATRRLLRQSWQCTASKLPRHPEDKPCECRSPEPEPEPPPGRRRHILFVDRTYPREIGNYGYGFILQGLRKDYDVVVGRDLCMDTACLVGQMERTSPLDAMVTHVPFDADDTLGMFGPGYTSSIEALAEIRRRSSIPIVAYTGADGLYSLAMWDYIDRKVPKTNDYQRDLNTIRKYLRDLILEAEMPFAVSLPKIERAEGATTVEARVNLRGGAGMRVTSRICEICEGYPGRVTLHLLEPGARWTIVDGDDPIGLMVFELAESCRVLVKVEGTDTAAEHLAKRLYGILTARYGYENSTGSSDNSK